MSKKLISALLVMLMLTMSISGISAVAEDVPTLTIFLEDCVTVEDFETNAATKTIEERLGCNLDFIIAPVGSAVEKMNILLNSNEYPDIFYGTVPDENLYGVESGLLADLTEYIDNVDVMPNLNYLFELRPNLKSQLKAVDGSIYAFPQYSEAYHMTFPKKAWYNAMQLEKLGLDMPKTIDEFYDAMVAFKAANPDGIALAGCSTDLPFAFIINAFTYYPQDGANSAGAIGLRNHNGTVECLLNTEEYRDALRFLNKLFAEELLYEGTFTMDGSQLKALLGQENEPVLFWSAMHNVMYVDGNATPDLYAHQEGIHPLVGPSGAQYVTNNPSQPVAYMSVSAACENKELAAKFADFHYSPDGARIVSDGVEGEQWRWCEEGEKSLLGFPGVAVRVGEYITDVQNVKWEPRRMALDVPEILTMLDIGDFDWDEPSLGVYVRYLGTQQQYAPYYQDEYKTIPTQKFSGDEQEELSMLTVSLENYVAESRVGFITGKLSLDDDWDSYVASLESMGIADAIALYQTALDRTK